MDKRGLLWTHEEIEQLKSEINSGLGCEQIAERRGRTPYAIVGKMQSLGWLVLVGRSYHLVNPDAWITGVGVARCAAGVCKEHPGRKGPHMTQTALAKIEATAPIEQPWTKELIRAIALDIGQELVAYIEVMYPEAIKATSSTFKQSMRNHVYNQIMAAVQVNDAGQIEARLQERKKHRREWVNAYRKIRRRRKGGP